jgi:hypothetical protein
VRWSEEQLSAHLAKSGTKATEVHKSEKPRAAPRAESKLEAELRGNLEVMSLRPFTPQHRFHPERRWRFDFAFPDVLVGVEIDGGIFAAENGETAGRHARGAGILSGFEKKNAAAELGWCVLSYGPPQIRSGEAALQIERIVTARRSGAGGLLLLRERDGTGV